MSPEFKYALVSALPVYSSDISVLARCQEQICAMAPRVSQSCNTPHTHTRMKREIPVDEKDDFASC